MNRKNLLTCATTGLMVFAAVANGFAQGEKKGPRIELKQEEVHFIDETGKVKSKLSLKEEIKYELKEKLVSPKEKKTFNIIKLTTRLTKTSRNNKYLILTRGTREQGIKYEDGREELFYDADMEEEEVSLYDVTGKVLWSKQLPQGRGASSDMMVSDNGEAVAINTWDSLFRREEEPKNVIFVYDKKGDEIQRVPSQKDRAINKEFRVINLEGISPNAKYLAVSVSQTYTSPPITRFYNLKSGFSWDSDKRYFIFNISNEGVVEGDTGGTSPIEYIDLKNFIGD